MRSICFTLSVACLLTVAWPCRADPVKGETPPADPSAVEVHFTDGSVLKMTMQEDSFEIVSSAGKKTVRLADLRKVELAHRLSDDDAKKINAAIKTLGSENFKERQNATIELVRCGLKAYPALLVASKGDDAEIRKRAGDIIETLKQAFPDETFEPRTEDVLWTKDGKLVGKIDKTTWKANTKQFGPLHVKLTDVVRVRWSGYADPEEKVDAQADPGTMDALVGQVGKVHTFKVTGAAQGSAWGTGTYTSDSTIAVAAVHAGLLKVGQTKVIKLKVVAGLNAYMGSTANGVTTRNWGPWDGAYEFVK